MLIENVDQLAYKARLQSDVYVLHFITILLVHHILIFWVKYMLSVQRCQPHFEINFALTLAGIIC